MSEREEECVCAADCCTASIACNRLGVFSLRCYVVYDILHHPLFSCAAPLVSYFAMAQRIFSVYNCVTEGGVRYLSAAPYISCDSAEYRGMLACSVLATVAVLLGVPLFFVYKHLRHSHRNSHSRSREGEGEAVALGLELGFLWRYTHRKYWWWEAVVITLRKLLLAMALSLPSRKSIFLPIGVILILALAVLLQSAFRPYKKRSDNATELILLCIALPIAYASVLTSTNISGAFTRADSQRLSDAAGYVVVVINFFFFFLLGQRYLLAFARCVRRKWLSLTAPVAGERNDNDDGGDNDGADSDRRRHSGTVSFAKAKTSDLSNGLFAAGGPDVDGRERGERACEPVCATVHHFHSHVHPDARGRGVLSSPDSGDRDGVAVPSAGGEPPLPAHVHVHVHAEAEAEAEPVFGCDASDGPPPLPQSHHRRLSGAPHQLSSQLPSQLPTCTQLEARPSARTISRGGGGGGDANGSGNGKG